MSSTAAVFYRFADIIIEVRADLPITPETFAHKLLPFQVDTPSKDTVLLHHHFGIPKDTQLPENTLIYRLLPWTISSVGTKFIYDGHYPKYAGMLHFMRGVWTKDHAHGHLYHADDTMFRRGQCPSLTLMPTDQVLFGQLLAERQGCLVHSAGMALWDRGFLFIGHSSAGKSTTARMLQEHGTILCDDRIAVRRMPEGFRIYGTWCHGDVPDISPMSVPLHALCFIEQAETNEAIRITDPREIVGRLMSCLVKPFTPAEWWTKTLAVVEALVREVPAYRLLRDQSGRIVDVLRTL